MLVDNPIEIYTAVFGVKMYDNMFNILTSFGITFLPILVIIGHAFHRLTSSALENVTSAVIRSVLCELLLYAIFLMIFVVPSYPFDVTGVKFKDRCSDAEAASFMDTGTTLDDTMSELVSEGQFDDIRLPPGMIFFLEGVSGVTAAATQSVACPLDLDHAISQINTTNLTPDIAKMAIRFNNECFKPAKAKYMSHTDDQRSVQELTDQYGGVEDLSWIGSHTFQELYYPTMYAHSEVKGFSVAQYPGPYAQNNEEAGVSTDEYGKPDCESWWNDPSNGLQKQLTDLVENHDNQAEKNSHIGYQSTWTTVDAVLAKYKSAFGVGNQMTADDVIARSLLSINNNNGGFSSSTQQEGNGLVHSVLSKGYWEEGGNIADGLLTTVSQGIEAPFSHIKKNGIKKETPILRALVLSIFLALGPLVLIVGCYRANVIFTYYFVTGSLVFSSFLSTYLNTLEQEIHSSLQWSPYTIINESFLTSAFATLDFIVPIGFLTIMAICGAKVGGSMNSITGQSGSSDGKSAVKLAGLL